MDAYKVETVLTEDGTLKLQQSETPTLFPDSNQDPLRSNVIRYDEPFEPAVPLEDWEALH